MKYQIRITENEGKLQPTNSGSVVREAPRSVILKPYIEIGGVGYWQKRINKLISDCQLDERAVVQVAEGSQMANMQTNIIAAGIKMGKINV